MKPNLSKEVVRHQATVTRERRERLNGHRAMVVWFTGLSGAGKSTVAHSVEEALHQNGQRTFVLDGDNVRHGLCADLGFSPADRHENLRRIGEIAKLFIEGGTIALAAFISPLQADREHVRQIIGPDDFVEIYVACPLEVCEQRDVKGMYRRARAGEIEDFTGVSAPYEPPESPDLILDTSTTSLADCVGMVLSLLRSRGGCKEGPVEFCGTVC